MQAGKFDYLDRILAQTVRAMEEAGFEFVDGKWKHPPWQLLAERRFS